MGGIFGKSRFSRSFSDTTSARAQSSKNGPTSFDHQNSGRYMVTPYIFKRRSSMYIDEDGDVAHEFYVESPPSKMASGHSCRTLRRIDPNHLRPQGYVDYDIPRLHPDVPCILAEITSFNDL